MDKEEKIGAKWQKNGKAKTEGFRYRWFQGRGVIIMALTLLLILCPKSCPHKAKTAKPSPLDKKHTPNKRNSLLMRSPSGKLKEDTHESCLGHTSILETTTIARHSDKPG